MLEGVPAWKKCTGFVLALHDRTESFLFFKQRPGGWQLLEALHRAIWGENRDASDDQRCAAGPKCASVDWWQRSSQSRGNFRLCCAQWADSKNCRVNRGWTRGTAHRITDTIKSRRVGVIEVRSVRFWVAVLFTLVCERTTDRLFRGVASRLVYGAPRTPAQLNQCWSKRKVQCVFRRHVSDKDLHESDRPIEGIP